MKEEKIPNKALASSHTLYTILLIVRYLVWGAAALTGLVVASLNAERVVLHYFWGTLSCPLYLILLGSSVVGWLMGMTVNLMSQIRLNRSHRRLEEETLTLKNEIRRLKKDFKPDLF